VKESFVNNLFCGSNAEFDKNASAIFKFQYEQNEVYHSFCNALGQQKVDIMHKRAFPFLPVSFFKTHRVVCNGGVQDQCFESSGTQNSIQSRHYIKDPSIYEQSFSKGFRLFYGNPEEWCFLGLLPSYLERQHSSLVYMVEQLMKQSKHSQNGFYLHNFQELHHQIIKLESIGQQTMLFGVTYALVDFAEQYNLTCSHTVIMETGGMKGRRHEMVRNEVHDLIKKKMGVEKVHSEYGMTELLSQAYSKGDGLFQCPPWMKVLVRDEDAPLEVHKTGRGALNIIDLANIYSCSFIATDDVGEVFEDGSFKVMGRLDNSDIRGCSLLAL
jgi:hypothetical protein